MKKTHLLCVLAVMGAAAGCSALLPSAPAPVYYQIQIPEAAVPLCPSGKAQPLRVWALDSAPPYDRTELILKRNPNIVELSSRHRWISPPSEMTAQAIVEAASQARVFPIVNRPGSPGFAPELHLGGRIREFAFHFNEGHGEAVLDVRVIVWREAKPKKLLFQKIYRIKESTTGGTSPEELTQAMNRAVTQWVGELTRDLCQAPLDTNT